MNNEDQHTVASWKLIWRPALRPVVCASAILWACTTHAQAADNSWIAGGGPDIREASVRSGHDDDITVSCGIRSPFPVTGISFRLDGQRSRGRWVELSFDGERPRRYPIRDGAITSDTTDMAMAYLDAITHMRHGSSMRVHFEDGREARFALTGAEHAIADCQPDVERLSSEPHPVSSLGR